MNIVSIVRAITFSLLFVFTSANASSSALQFIMSPSGDGAENKVYQAEIILENLSVIHESSIANLNLSEKQLNSEVYVNLDSWRKYSTLKEFLSVFYELSTLKSIQVKSEGDYLVFRIKLAGRPPGGYVLYLNEGEYFLKGVVADDGFVISQSQKDDQFIFGDYYGFANSVFVGNGLQ